MFFDDSLKELKKELKIAGADLSYVRQWQKVYDKVKKQKDTLEGQYVQVKQSLNDVYEALKELEKVLILVLPLVAVVVLSPRLFRDGDEELKLNSKTWAVAIGASILIGFYDGFYGPGTGTFLIIAFTVLAGINPRRANAQAKVINLSSNIAGLTVFILNGQVFFPLGLAAAVCNMAGNYVGAGLAITKGSRITRPVIILVLVLLFLKILGVI